MRGRTNQLKPRLVVLCVDGATPEMVETHRLFRYGQASDDSAPLRRLQTIYPSSTAPAHASMLTGVPPGVHGIVGNRFWDNATPQIVSAAYADPLASIHPYERASLRTRSLLDRFTAQGLRVACVLFPLTFSVAEPSSPIDSTYCLYAPSRRFQLIWQTPALELPRSEAAPLTAQLELTYFGMRLVFGFSLATDGRPRLQIVETNVRRAEIVEHGGVYDVYAYQARSSLVFTLAVEELSPARITLHQSTAVLTLCSGQLRIDDLVHPGNPPHSRQIDYSANPQHAFYESPSISWVTQTALALLKDAPDVLLIRYSQVDHAQEYLHWYAVRGTAAERQAATAQILDAYRKVEQGISTILEQLDPRTPFYIFSDHGIDVVDTHISINAMLYELQLADEFVFQGDSSCCYLYGSRPPADTELTALRRFLEAHVPQVWISSPDELRALGAYHPDRCGHLALRCTPHTEFQFGPGPLVATVQSASHGFAATCPEMDGIWLPFRGVRNVRQPDSILDLAALTTQLCQP